MEDCPKIVKKRGEILYRNGPGFQPLGNGFVIAGLADEIELNKLEKIREESKAKSVNCINWIGRDFLTIYWSEYCLINKVFNTLLNNGISFNIFTKFGVHFDPERDKEYSREIAESKFVNDQNKYIEDISLQMYNNCIKSSGRKYAILHEFNYSTQKGKNFCRELRKKMKKERLISNETCSKPEKSNYLTWDIFKNYNPMTLQTKQEKEENENENENLCIICFENQPNTIVSPCGHCVVCKKCPDGLKNTNDKKTCVACRNYINFIEECT